MKREFYNNRSKTESATPVLIDDVIGHLLSERWIWKFCSCHLKHHFNIVRPFSFGQFRSAIFDRSIPFDHFRSASPRSLVGSEISPFIYQCLLILILRSLYKWETININTFCLISELNRKANSDLLNTIIWYNFNLFYSPRSNRTK